MHHVARCRARGSAPSQNGAVRIRGCPLEVSELGEGAHVQAAAAGALAESLAGQLAALQREAVAAREEGRAAAAAAAAAAERAVAELNAARRDAAAAAAAAADEADTLRLQAAAAEARAPQLNRALLGCGLIKQRS